MPTPPAATRPGERGLWERAKSLSNSLVGLTGGGGGGWVRGMARRGGSQCRASKLSMQSAVAQAKRTTRDQLRKGFRESEDIME